MKLIEFVCLAVLTTKGLSSPSAEVRESLMDSLYGELVATPESRHYQAQMMTQGEVRPPAAENKIASFDQRAVWDSLDAKDAVGLQQALYRHFESQKTSREQPYNDHFYAKAHESYMKARGKVHLPADDDTSDIFDENGSLFGGIVTFGRFPHFNCFDKESYNRDIDIAVVGAPFDTGVSYRPGARFGPNSVREASKRLGGLSMDRGRLNKHNSLAGINPYDTNSHNYSIIDCGDVPMTPFDNRIALNQLYRGERAIHKHSSKTKPRVVTIGGDHTVTLMALRSAYEQYGQLSVIHFDSHIDTWDPKVLGGGLSSYMALNHGTFLHYAAEQGYLNKGACFHAGMRAPFIDASYDRQHDADCGFNIFTARDLDRFGPVEIARRIKQKVGSSPIYISVDIDVLDPANAPATGTMEIGGWTSRELLNVLDALQGLDVVGADVVEVSPPYDSHSEVTSLAATAVIDSFLGLIINSLNR
ncbi:Piso0_002968 [Millerozyma farinosa CBS 7064]|uniref:Piso0_002968 protein n=1 Tax=Pichia sorbitophila (strain ATCC MYA-4447 / BCRC 22081 / CBS 7064 / NBRC 10061 / NRRL Y-12695) TaxID=559304 RepID=G8YGT9_PICSO|nr:Piso0_002968 [Millerozyma farinosa CBS 7064]CCE80641.1 Piso0_002968 [Millerozyma farinosa CBS 7064]